MCTRTIHNPYYVNVFTTSGANWAARHLPGGPVGPPASWAATSNVAGGSGKEERVRGP